MQSTISKTFLTLATGALLGLSTLSTSVSAQTSELIDLLTSKTGVTAEQATGGASALFAFAKSALSAEQFSKISSALPEVAQFTQANATNKGSISSAVSDLAASLVGSSDSAAKLGKISELKNSFDQLGIDTKQIQDFIPVIVDYAKSHGTEAVSGLLNQALAL